MNSFVLIDERGGAQAKLSISCLEPRAAWWYFDDTIIYYLRLPLPSRAAPVLCSSAQVNIKYLYLYLYLSLYKNLACYIYALWLKCCHTHEVHTQVSIGLRMRSLQPISLICTANTLPIRYNTSRLWFVWAATTMRAKHMLRPWHIFPYRLQCVSFLIRCQPFKYLKLRLFWAFDLISYWAVFLYFFYWPYWCVLHAYKGKRLLYILDALTIFLRACYDFYNVIFFCENS